MKSVVVNGLERVDKRKAFELYKTGELIYITPCNLKPRPLGTFTFALSCEPCKDNLPKNLPGCAAKFEDRVLGFKKYYCNSEIGTYPAFYIKKRKQEQKRDTYTMKNAAWVDFTKQLESYELSYGDFKDIEGDKFYFLVEYYLPYSKTYFYMVYEDDAIMYNESNRQSVTFFNKHISKEYMDCLIEYICKKIKEQEFVSTKV